MSSLVSSLSKDLHNMDLSINAKSPLKATERAPPMDLTVPNLQTGDRKIIYAFNITEEWLVQYWNETSTPDCPDIHRRVKMEVSYFRLLRVTGIRELGFESGVVDDVATAEGTIILTGGGSPFVPLLAICNSLRGSYRRRPTQEQFDRLRKIVGKEPRWWVDFYDYPEGN